MKVESKIKQYLEENHIQQKVLSEVTGIPIPRLNLTLNGRRNLKFDEYELICGALRVDVNTFLEARIPEQSDVDGEDY